MIRKPKSGQFNPLILLIMILAALGIAAQLAYRQYLRIGHAKRAVVVAATRLIPGMVIAPQHIQVVEAQEKKIPLGALVRAKDVVGRQVTKPIEKGSALLGDDVTASGIAQGLARAVPEGRVLTSLTLLNATIPHQDLRQGDRVDILAAGYAKDQTRTAYVVARNVIVVGYTTPPVRDTPNNSLFGVDMGITGEGSREENRPILLVALKPQDVLPVAQIDGMPDVRVSLVLHGTEEVKSGQLLSVERTPPFYTSVQVILGAQSHEVTFR